MPSRVVIALFIAVISAAPLRGQDKLHINWQPLWPDGAPGAKGKEPADIPALAHYPAPAEKATGAAIVVCPGGGYGGLALDHEGVQIARWLNEHGITAVILKYRLGPRYNHPAPLTDAQRALRTTRARAKEWNIDSQRVGILGFSAGGHLASTAGTHFDMGDPAAADPIDRLSSRPDFQVLVYPVIALSGIYAHAGSRANLLGKTPDPKLVAALSTNTKVSAETPPAFLVHTSEDKAVPPENSVLFYLACRSFKVPAELHIYEHGRHGLGLGPKEMAFSSWPDRCIAWLNARGILKASRQP